MKFIVEYMKACLKVMAIFVVIVQRWLIDFSIVMGVEFITSLYSVMSGQIALFCIIKIKLFP